MVKTSQNMFLLRNHLYTHDKKDILQIVARFFSLQHISRVFLKKKKKNIYENLSRDLKNVAQSLIFLLKI